jgi:hypothetical protein
MHDCFTAAPPVLLLQAVTGPGIPCAEAQLQSKQARVQQLVEHIVALYIQYLRHVALAAATIHHKQYLPR